MEENAVSYLELLCIIGHHLFPLSTTNFGYLWYTYIESSSIYNIHCTSWFCFREQEWLSWIHLLYLLQDGLILILRTIIFHECNIPVIQVNRNHWKRPVLSKTISWYVWKFPTHAQRFFYCHADILKQRECVLDIMMLMIMKNFMSEATRRATILVEIERF